MSYTMRRIGLGAVMLLLVAACSSDDSAEITVTTTAPVSTTTGAVTTTVAPATTAATVVAEGTSCVDCHTDEDTLKALAVEPPDLEGLSEGEG